MFIFRRRFFQFLASACAGILLAFGSERQASASPDEDDANPNPDLKGCRVVTSRPDGTVVTIEYDDRGRVISECFASPQGVNPNKVVTWTYYYTDVADDPPLSES